MRVSTYIANVMLYHVRLWITQRVIETIHANAVAIKAVRRAVDGQNGSSSIGFGHTPIAFHTNQFGPYFIVDLLPLVEDFQYVVLNWNKEHTISDWHLMVI